jgi:protocatechuate 3,4-dioxygenase, alpha subunit
VSRETPFQTIGPFFHYALSYDGGDVLVTPATLGSPIVVEGVVRDGAGAAVPDALVEIWQANAAGRYAHPDDASAAAVDPAFDGFGRTPTDGDGRFAFTTIKPGRVPGPHGVQQAPHILVGLLGRGLLTRLVTRVYFEDEPSTAEDPILSLVPEARRATLIARRIADGRYRFDIVLQGEGETVFFDM